MKKIAILMFAIWCFFEAGECLAEFSIGFNSEEAKECKDYAFFVFVFGQQMDFLVVKEGDFEQRHVIGVLPGTRERRSKEQALLESGIAIIIDNEKKPFLWIKMGDLISDNDPQKVKEKIFDKAIEFSIKTYEKLKELEGRRTL